LRRSAETPLHKIPNVSAFGIFYLRNDVANSERDNFARWIFVLRFRNCKKPLFFAIFSVGTREAEINKIVVKNKTFNERILL